LHYRNGSAIRQRNEINGVQKNKAEQGDEKIVEKSPVRSRRNLY